MIFFAIVLVSVLVGTVTYAIDTLRVIVKTRTMRTRTDYVRSIATVVMCLIGLLAILAFVVVCVILL